MAKELLTSPLNRLPEGLLDFFSIKSMGQYPQSFSAELRGVLDLTRWYSDIRAIETSFSLTTITVAAVSSLLAIGTTNWTVPAGSGPFDPAFGAATTQVPNSELWLMLESEVHWDLGVAAAGRCDGAALIYQRAFSIIQEQPITNGPVLGAFANSAAITNRRGQLTQQTPFWCLPGGFLGVRHYGLDGTGGGVTISGAVRFLRLLR